MSSAPNRPLRELDPLVGEWAMEGAHPAFPTVAHGTSVFEWLLDGCLLLWRFDWEPAGPPSAVGVVGRDDSEHACTMVYGDERGLTRVYRMTIDGGVWRMTREAPGFSQRMTGSFSDDGNQIVVNGELSRDGSMWERDLDVTYTRRVR